MQETASSTNRAAWRLPHVLHVEMYGPEDAQPVLFTRLGPTQHRVVLRQEDARGPARKK